MLLSIQSISAKAIFGDRRLNVRFEKILSVLMHSIEHSIPLTFKTRGPIKAVYRFLNNNKVTDKVIVESQSDLLPIEKGAIYLAIHDSTEIDLTGHRAGDDLGCLSYENKKGFYLHNTLLCDSNGIPECVFAQHFWSRDAESLSKKLERKHLPMEEKESYRWVNSAEKVIHYFENYPEATAINICDREGDIYELLAKHTGHNVHYIIRSCNNRRTTTENKLWDEVKLQSIKFTYDVEIYDRQLSKKRKAQLEVRWLNDIALLPPYRKHDKLNPITTGLIYVQEVNCTKNVTPIEWKLITSMPLVTNEQILTAITYYSFRWRIESFHYILKQGCSIEDLQLEQVQSLKSAISLYSIISCRLLSMMYLSRENPDADLKKIGITEGEFKILHVYLENVFNFKFDKETKRPTIGNFTLLIGRLGGFLKKKTEHPGIKILWRGMKEFTTVLGVFKLKEEIKCG